MDVPSLVIVPVGWVPFEVDMAVGRSWGGQQEKNGKNESRGMKEKCGLSRVVDA